MDNILPIVYSIDDNYTLPVMVAIRSLQINKQDKYKLKIYIFNAELKEENQLKIKSIEKPDCQIEFVSVNEYIKGANLYDCHDFSVAMYYRFFIPIILSQYEKVLYLDTDTLVKGCVSKIFKEDWKITTKCLLIFLTSFLFEVIQFIFAIGASDVTDLIGNTFGGIIGILFCIIMKKIAPKKFISIINVLGMLFEIAAIGLLLLLLTANR